MPYYKVANLVTLTKMNIIDEMPYGCGTLKTTGVRTWHEVSCRACEEVLAALEVCCGPVPKSQQLSKASAALRRGHSSSKFDYSKSQR